MAMTISVYFSGSTPTSADLQQALRALGFPLTIADLTKPLDSYCGFMPMTFDDGDETGVEVYVGALDPTQRGQGIPEIDETFDRLMSFRWAAGSIDETLAVFSLSAAAATVAKGAIFDDQSGSATTVEQMIKDARELARQSGRKLAQPRRKPTVRPYVRELLREFPEFGFASRVFYLRPVQDILVGYTVDHPPSGPRLWALRLPLYELSEFVHLSYATKLASFLPNGEPWRPRDAPKDVSQALLQLEADRKRWTANDERAFAARLIPIIREHRPALLKLQSLEGSAAELGASASRPNGLRSKTYGLTCLMLGDVGMAKRVLSAVPLDHLKTEERVAELTETLRILEEAPGEARDYRMRTVDEMRLRLGVE